MPASFDARRYLRYIAANIRDARKRLGFTQERLAERADVDVKFLQRIEAACTNLSVAVLVRIAVALRLTPGQLLVPATLAKSRRGRPKKA